MADHDIDERSRRILDQIAKTLDPPVETFLDGVAAERAVLSKAEEVELLALFRGLRDPGDRRRCIDLIRAMAMKGGEYRALT